jgi:putative endonuclease
MFFYSYILKSLKDSRYYYGSCENIDKRLGEHNCGKVKATKNRIPFVVHYFEEHNSRSEAYKRELFYKSIDGYKWLKEQKIT